MMAVIGGGASGLLASILISRKNIKVTLLERGNRVGKKILASGNGKCNIGNINPISSFYHSSNPSFIEKVLKGYGAKEIINIFKTIGIEIIEGKDGKLFPISLQASSVLDILEYEARKLGVQIICNCNINNIVKEGNKFIIKTDDSNIISEKILLATGSPASPQLGGSNSGLDIASSLGHNIITSLPSLVQLSSDETWVKDISGVKVYSIVKLYANSKYITQKEGDVLFTNYGVSGLAILDISREVSLELANYSYCELSIDLMPNYTKEVLLKMFLSHINNYKPIDIWLNGFINKKLIPIILNQSKCKIKDSKNLNRKEIAKIIYSIKNFKLSISDTRGFKGAEVAIGGVDTEEVNPITMESTKVKNLYLAGEILDIDGDRGGFNFHFAWVSAMRVGNSF
ncbi:NAD(FAD)-utilizing dehydrogenases [hydrothermal vent metagenome]|uniref:NAD(FAD)-utilizing dehydrogenases n=1 Tax=hydrothermal vent metagenome TaxID=652676 RepID=A0A1W1CE57_9ZZZZ